MKESTILLRFNKFVSCWNMKILFLAQKGSIIQKTLHKNKINIRIKKINQIIKYFNTKKEELIVNLEINKGKEKYLKINQKRRDDFLLCF
jgi:hypothetical protein